jgi:UDP-glucose/GDP-mannose dehydrogenase family, NAD binding domain
MSIAPLRVTVVGTGYLGLTHAVCLADLGHEALRVHAAFPHVRAAAAVTRIAPTPGRCSDSRHERLS